MKAHYSVRSNNSGSTPVIELAGQCDLLSAPDLRDAIATAFEAGASSLVIDLEEVEFLDSAALGTFLGARRRAGERGGSVTLLCSSPSMLRLLCLMELHQIFDIKPRTEWQSRPGGAAMN